MSETDHRPLIAHVIYALNTGGLENGMVNILNRMPAERYRHAIICITRSSAFAERITHPGVSIYELDESEGHSWELYRKFRRLIKQLRPSLVHTRNLATLEMHLATLFIPGVRRIHAEHGRDIFDLEGKNKKYNILRRVVGWFLDRYIAVSEDLAQWFRATVKIPADKVDLIYDGVDLQRFSPEGKVGADDIPKGFYDPETVVVGVVGRLAEVKNHRLLIDAFANMVEDFPEQHKTARLLIVGDGPLNETLMRQIKERDLESLVYMAGDRSDVPELVRLMDIFVLPSLAEGVPNTILEAMSCGLPIVATDVGGNSELIDDGVHGRLVRSKDCRQLAEVLLELMQSPSDRVRMGQAGRAKVLQQFDWELTKNHYLSLYDELIKPKGRPV